MKLLFLDFKAKYCVLKLKTGDNKKIIDKNISIHRNWNYILKKCIFHGITIFLSYKKAHTCKFRNPYNLHFMWKHIKTNFLSTLNSQAIAKLFKSDLKASSKHEYLHIQDLHIVHNCSPPFTLIISQLVRRTENFTKLRWWGVEGNPWTCTFYKM